MSIFASLLQDPSNLSEEIEKFEASCDLESGERLSPIVGTEDGGKWYRVRRLASFLIWDIYAAAAMAHYRRNQATVTAPLLNNMGIVSGTLPDALAETMEKAYFECPSLTRWVDNRPPGHSFYPFDTHRYFEGHDQVTMHRVMTPDMGNVVTEALTLLAPEIEKIVGHYWTAGAVRVFAAIPHNRIGYHSDEWPRGLKKIMLYPSGASVEQGTTEFVMPDGTSRVLQGGKGLWAVFENTLLNHRALPPQNGTPRPTIELAIIPSFKTDPTVRQTGIHVGYPWLPPDLDELTGNTCATGFKADEIKERTYLRMLMLGNMLPKEVQVPEPVRGYRLGIYD